ncbi:hypothetical protein [Paraburkholderia silvatlantica]|uniref:C2H2-type domain-containing protein n=1 Tax=Paraburkholderia silvatlantica TaxID=321895 RepID=A0ABR6FL45_9BURK|nr:hypothetical protein [Paraburkholderia silvatlantica]MBB2928161.1 hypothetical protein [Paraburkholderia silvatlantica]
MPGIIGHEAVTLVKLHVRGPAVSRDTFLRWWLCKHASRVVARSEGRASRYERPHSIGQTEPCRPFCHPQACGIDPLAQHSKGRHDDWYDVRSGGRKVDDGIIDAPEPAFWGALMASVATRHPLLAHSRMPLDEAPRCGRITLTTARWKTNQPESR